MCLASLLASEDHFEDAQGCDCQGRVIAVACVGIAHRGLYATDGISAKAVQGGVFEWLLLVELMAPAAQMRIPARAAGLVAMPAIKCRCNDPVGNVYALSQSGPIKSAIRARKA